jgi:hypothetical protein
MLCSAKACRCTSLWATASPQSVQMTEHHAMSTYGGRGGVPPHNLNVDARLRDHDERCSLREAPRMSVVRGLIPRATAACWRS